MAYYRKRSRKRSSFPKYKHSSISRLISGAEYKQLLKKQGKLYCHVCGWFDPLILPYFGLESHHIKQYRDGGKNANENYLVCCPNCHRIADIISKANRNLRLTRDILIALIREHEFNRFRSIK